MEAKTQKGEEQKNKSDGLPTIVYKRINSDSVNVEIDLANGWINLYTQKEIEITTSGVFNRLGLEITMPKNLWALVFSRIEGVVITNNLIPSGFRGRLIIDLRLIDDCVTGRRFNPNIHLISIVPFTKADFTIREEY